MTTCERLSDRMAAVARGDSAWSAEESAHLAACGDCGAEWRLLRAAQALGAASIDPNAMAARVAARLAQVPEPGAVVRPIAPWRRPSVWGLALAAAVILAVMVPRGRDSRPANGDVGAPVPAAGPVLSGLDDLSAGELESVLDAVEGPSVDADRARTGDLTPAELERVLGSWES